MIKRMYDWTLSMSGHPRSLWVLAFVAFIESSFFPIPPDLLLSPLILATPTRAFGIALIAVIASVAGGVFGYLIGAFAFEAIGQPILASLGKMDYMADFNEKFNEYGLWAVLIAGITPFPFKVITIMSGWTSMPFGVFVFSSLAARSIRFFSVAALLYYCGVPIRHFIERRLNLVFTVFIFVLIAGFLIIRVM